MTVSWHNVTRTTFCEWPKSYGKILMSNLRLWLNVNCELIPWFSWMNVFWHHEHVNSVVRRVLLFMFHFQINDTSFSVWSNEDLFWNNCAFDSFISFISKQKFCVSFLMNLLLNIVSFSLSTNNLESFCD